jgi:hypothetical protein
LSYQPESRPRSEPKKVMVIGNELGAVVGRRALDLRGDFVLILTFKYII